VTSTSPPATSATRGAARDLYLAVPGQPMRRKVTEWGQGLRVGQSERWSRARREPEQLLARPSGGRGERIASTADEEGGAVRGEFVARLSGSRISSEIHTSTPPVAARPCAQVRRIRHCWRGGRRAQPSWRGSPEWSARAAEATVSYGRGEETAATTRWGPSGEPPFSSRNGV